MYFRRVSQSWGLFLTSFILVLSRNFRRSEFAPQIIRRQLRSIVAMSNGGALKLYD